MLPTDVIAALEAPTDDRRGVMRRLEADAPAEVLGAALEQAPEPLTRQLLADLLGRQAAAGAAPALLGALADPVQRVRSAAADALGKVLLAHGPGVAPDAGAALLARWEAEDAPSVRHMLAAALGAAHHEPARGLLELAAASDDAGLRRTSAWALEQLGPPPAR